MLCYERKHAYGQQILLCWFTLLIWILDKHNLHPLTPTLSHFAYYHCEIDFILLSFLCFPGINPIGTTRYQDVRDIYSGSPNHDLNASTSQGPALSGVQKINLPPSYFYTPLEIVYSSNQEHHQSKTIRIPKGICGNISSIQDDAIRPLHILLLAGFTYTLPHPNHKQPLFF